MMDNQTICKYLKIKAMNTTLMITLYINSKKCLHIRNYQTDMTIIHIDSVLHSKIMIINQSMLEFSRMLRNSSIHSSID